VARKNGYTKKLAATICTRITCGESLGSICKTPGMPSVATVYRWLASNSEFRELYTTAREDQADTLADQILQIADETPLVKVKCEDGKDEEKPLQVDGAAVQLLKLRVDARKFLAAKLKPKKYSERSELTGAGGEPLIPSQYLPGTPAYRMDEIRRLAWLLHLAGHSDVE
jgi:hypothetical protein